MALEGAVRHRVHRGAVLGVGVLIDERLAHNLVLREAGDLRRLPVPCGVEQRLRIGHSTRPKVSGPISSDHKHANGRGQIRQRDRVRFMTQ